jgi:PAS domain S-box-containing protein
VSAEDRAPDAEALSTALESEQRLRAVLRAAHEGIVVQARDGRILLWNDCAENVFGVTDSDVVGASALGRQWGSVHEDGSPWPPEQHPSMITLTTGEAQSDVLMGVTRGNEIRWIEIDTQPLFHPGEAEPYAAVISFADVTERRRAEQALGASEAKYRAVVDGTTDGIVIAQDGDLVYANAAFAQMSAYSREELDGIPFLTLVQEDQRDAIADRARRRLAGEDVPTTCDIDLVARSGAVFGVEVRADVIDYLGAPADLMIMRAVSERSRLQRRLDDERQRFRLLVENSGEAFLLSQPDGSIHSANPAACRLFGRSEDEIRRIGRDGLVDATDPRLSAGLKERALTGRFVGELRLVRADGSVFPGEVSTSIYTDHAGEQRTSMVIRDLTESNAAADELQRTAAMRDLVEEIAQMGGWTFDISTQVATWSPGMYRLFGLTPEEYDGGSLTPLLESRIHPDDRAAVAEATAASIAGERSVPIEYRVVLPDGTQRIVHGEGRTMSDPFGVPVSIVGYYRDVTEQRRAEAARLESERATSELLDRLNEAQGLAGIGSWEWDIASGRVWWSDETYVIFGVTPEQFTPSFEGNGALIHPDDREEYGSSFARSLQTGEQLDLDVRLIAGDGQLKSCNARGQVITDADGRPARFVGTVMDITVRRNAENEIRRLNAELEERVMSRTAQLEATNKELEAFAYSVSHDLRAPLRAIDGFSQMVIEDAGDKLAGDDIRHLQRVRDAAQRMAILIDELLGLSRASRREMCSEDVDVSALSVAVLDELCETQPERPVERVVAPGMRAQADPVLLRAILSNLLGNAWKFTSKHATARIEVGVVDAAGERAFFVRDDGAGFDPRHASHLFGAFQRMHPADAFEGEGIGLATVHRLVARHGGRVWAEAAVEKGATFYFTLPEPSATD